MRAYLLIFLLLFSAPLFAAKKVKCFSESPNLRKGQDIFEIVKTRELKRSEYKKLKQMFGNMRGYWKGKGIEVWCERNEYNKPVKSKTKFRLKAYIKKKGKYLYRFKLEMYDIKKQFTATENFDIYLTPKKLRYFFDDPRGATEIIRLSTSLLEFGFKERRRNGRIRNSLEYEKSIKKQHSGYQLQSTFYFHGELVNQVTWQLLKKTRAVRSGISTMDN